MRTGENVCLRLNSFHNDVKTFWQGFQVSEEFCDVTLACEDNQIKTHKMIISSCSPVLRNILKHNPNPHPLIYLRKVKFRDLQNMLHYMYQGEVNIAIEDLSSFLEMAEDLHIRGLSNRHMEASDSGKVEYFQNDHQNEGLPPNVTRTLECLQSSNDSYFLVNELEVPTNDINKEKISGHGDSANAAYYQNKVSSPKLKRPDEIMQDSIGADVWDSLSESLEINENSNFQRNGEKHGTASESERKKQSLVSLKTQKQFICEICKNKYNYSKSLLRHIMSVHEGIRYPCDHCAYKATDKDNLEKHVKSIHEGVRYPCKQCDYKAKQRGSLKIHVLNKHNFQ